MGATANVRVALTLIWGTPKAYKPHLAYKSWGSNMEEKPGVRLEAVVKLTGNRVVIPKDVCRKLGWKPGIKLKVLTNGKRVILEPA